MGSAAATLALPLRLGQLVDDIAAIAQAARRLPDIEARLTERIEALESQAEQILMMGEAAHRELARTVGPARALAEQAPLLLAAGERLEERARQTLPLMASLESRAAEVSERAGEVAAGLPMLDRAVARIEELVGTTALLVAAVEPLQGVTERVGRLADRLPGSQRPSR